MATDNCATSGLYRDDIEKYKAALAAVPAEVWKRWEEHREEYYRQCHNVIDYAVYHYGTRTPMGADELRARANLIFCIACLRWDPSGKASLPTYVAKQLMRLSGTDIRVESKHKNNRSQGPSGDGDGAVDLLTLIGQPDEKDTLREYVEKAGKDAILLYDTCISGWYDRKSNTGARRPITPRGLFLARALPWTCKERYEYALDAIRAAADAWRKGKDFKGYALLNGVANA